MKLITEMSNKAFKQLITGYELIYLACVLVQKKFNGDGVFLSIMGILLENRKEKTKFLQLS